MNITLGILSIWYRFLALIFFHVAYKIKGNGHFVSYLFRTLFSEIRFATHVWSLSKPDRCRSQIWGWSIQQYFRFLASIEFYYEWTKFILAVINRSSRWHSNNSKKNRKKLNQTFMIILGLPESFQTMNRPCHPNSTVMLFDSIYL